MEHRLDTDPLYAPTPVLMARPLIQGFCRSPFCAPEHRWHARSTLPVLALFVATQDEPNTAGLPWSALAPDALYRASRESDPDEREFLRDLLEVSAAFYAYLGAEGRVAPTRAHSIAQRLTALAAQLGRRAA
jgi:hypothetical protein